MNCIPVLTSTGRWEYMRIVERSPLHYVVRDASGNEFVAGKPSHINRYPFGISRVRRKHA